MMGIGSKSLTGRALIGIFESLKLDLWRKEKGITIWKILELLLRKSFRDKSTGYLNTEDETLPVCLITSEPSPESFQWGLYVHADGIDILQL